VKEDKLYGQIAAGSLMSWGPGLSPIKKTPWPRSAVSLSPINTELQVKHRGEGGGAYQILM